MIDFWRAAGRKKWLTTDLAFDAECRADFFTIIMRQQDAATITTQRLRRARWRSCCYWIKSHVNCSAAPVTCMPPIRSPECLRVALAAGHDKTRPEDLRPLFYLPFGPSEDIDDQELSVELNRALGPEE